MVEEKKGFFGLFKGTPAKDENKAGGSEQEVADFGVDFTQQLLDKMGFFTVVKVFSITKEEITLEIKGDEIGLIIGKEGGTLNALQLLVNTSSSKKFGQHARINLDVEGYRKKRQNHLEEIAQKAADTATQSGREVVLQPMSPAERRIVHLFLKDDQRVTTRSIGTGNDRKIVISAIKRKDNFFIP
jgi:spoIIIJ-associated protein